MTKKPMTKEEILAIATDLVVVNDGFSRWVGRRDEIYDWLEKNGLSRGYDDSHNTPNSVTMSVDQYQSLCDSTECLVDDSGSFGPADPHDPYELIDEIEETADCLYVY